MREGIEGREVRCVLSKARMEMGEARDRCRGCSGAEKGVARPRAGEMGAGRGLSALGTINKEGWEIVMRGLKMRY